MLLEKIDCKRRPGVPAGCGSGHRCLRSCSAAQQSRSREQSSISSQTLFWHCPKARAERRCENTRASFGLYKKYRKMPKLKTNSLKIIKNFVSSILGQTPESPNSEACLQDPVGHPAGKGRAQVCSPVQLSKLRNKEGNININ